MQLLLNKYTLIESKPIILFILLYILLMYNISLIYIYFLFVCIRVSKKRSIRVHYSHREKYFPVLKCN